MARSPFDLTGRLVLAAGANNVEFGSSLGELAGEVGSLLCFTD
jgi:hypothetical protein